MSIADRDAATAATPHDATLRWVLRDGRSPHVLLFTTDCNVVQDARGRWTLTVSRGDSTLVSQTCDSQSDALVRAEELQQILLQFGWTNRPSA